MAAVWHVEQLLWFLGPALESEKQHGNQENDSLHGFEFGESKQDRVVDGNSHLVRRHYCSFYPRVNHFKTQSKPADTRNFMKTCYGLVAFFGALIAIMHSNTGADPSCEACTGFG